MRDIFSAKVGFLFFVCCWIVCCLGAGCWFLVFYRLIPSQPEADVEILVNKGERGKRKGESPKAKGERRESGAGSCEGE